MGPVQIAAGEYYTQIVDDHSILRPRYGLHAFRHAAASLWIDQQVNPKRVQKWMGHSNIQVTFDTYGHLFDQAERDLIIATAVQDSVLGKNDAT